MKHFGSTLDPMDSSLFYFIFQGVKPTCAHHKGVYDVPSSNDTDPNEENLGNESSDGVTVTATKHQGVEP